jgi:hypothetical protein
MKLTSVERIGRSQLIPGVRRTLAGVTMIAALLLVLAGALSDAAAASRTRPVTAADTVLAVYTQDWGLGSHQGPRLIISAWSDGYVVWSQDRVQGGPPYLAGSVDPHLLSAGLSAAVRDGVFADKSLANPCFGPDSKFTTILLRHSGKQLRMDSWHEVAEHSGKVFAASCGLTALSRPRLEAMREEPPRYLYYRVVWSELRSLASSLIPATSRTVAGDVTMKAGVMAWVERPAP